ncbi:CpsD/CapB family tyrosine-protein kinase [Primorskyibacter sp. 2E107]|uniref:CpsD/CapB family tyrosine-protein kinase n=1 Tax=Primorskyibacter sp. 2E107 TaxID=3403458 RepID=UPI003AF8DEE4
MERIQAAIAKARAERQGNREIASPNRVPGNTGAHDIREMWKALPTHPLDPKLSERNRIVSSNHGAESAAFDLMRTRTLKMMQENGWKRLAITSPTAGCGKSTVAINLGLSLTRRDDVSAILMDADMRRPSLADKLGIRRNYLAADVLRGAADFSANACRISERFAVSTNDRTVPNSSDLLQAPLVSDILDRIEAEYAPTLMIFDMPPLMVNDDTIAFLRHVDCAMLVAAAEHTSIKEIDECEREIASQTNMLGVVLNKCKFNSGNYGYDYY